MKDIKNRKLRGCGWLFYVISLLTIFAPCLYKSVFARSIFELDVSVDDQTPRTESFDNIFDFIGGLDTKEILGLFPTYTDNSKLNATLDIRGLDAFGKFAKNDTTFVFEIPRIGIYEKFTGSTRDESMDEFVDWLKENGKGTLSKLMRGFAEHTPNDPVAGNPHSLMANLVSTDFNRAFSAEETSGIPADDTTSEKSSSEKITTTNSNLIALSPRFGSLRQGNLDNTQITLPIAYTIRFNSDPRYQINFSMPITWVEVDGANAYSTGLGVGFTFPVPYIDNWSLTPAVSYGGVGSVDLASLSQVISGSLTSIYTFKIGKYLLKLGNMGGYYRTMPFPFSVSGFDIREC